MPNRRSEAARELLARRKARRSFADFCRYVAPYEPPAKHHLLICDVADRIIEGSCKRAMFFMPPGSAKSTYATIRFPAYYLATLPRKGVICASYNDTLASQFGRKTRNLVRQDEVRRLYPDFDLAADAKAKGEWDTTNKGFYFSTGIGGGVTGRRADLAIIDDPIKGRKDADSQLVRDNCWNWYMDDLRTRLKPGASMLVIQTRWHQDDLSGRILPEDWDGQSGIVKARDGEDWEVICLPAQAKENDILGRDPGEWLWLDWFDEKYWEQTKASVCMSGTRSWTSLYQQTPTDDDGTYFKREWFKRYIPGEEPVTKNYQSTDFATKDGEGDYTELGVFGVDHDREVWIKDWWYGQKTTDVWIAQQYKQYKEHNCYASFGETGPIRRAVEPFQDMYSRQHRIFPRMEWLVRSGDKTSEARSFQGLASAGMIHIPYTDWGERLLDQLCKFPNAKFDDAVDVCALFGRALAESNPAILQTETKKAENRDAWGRARSPGGGSWRT